MTNKMTLAIVAALATAIAASSAFAQSDTTWRSRADGHHYRYDARRIYNSAPQAAQNSPYAVDATGGGSLGYNQHNEVKN